MLLNIQHHLKLTQSLRFLMSVMLITILLFGCKHNEEENGSADSGEITIALTDAKGDFTNYTVDIESLTLTKQNGTTVQVYQNPPASIFRNTWK